MRGHKLMHAITLQLLTGNRPSCPAVCHHALDTHLSILLREKKSTNWCAPESEGEGVVKGARERKREGERERKGSERARARVSESER